MLGIVLSVVVSHGGKPRQDGKGVSRPFCRVRCLVNYQQSGGDVCKGLVDQEYSCSPDLAPFLMEACLKSVVEIESFARVSGFGGQQFARNEITAVKDVGPLSAASLGPGGIALKK